MEWTAGPDGAPTVLSKTGFDIDHPIDVYAVGNALGLLVGAPGAIGRHLDSHGLVSAGTLKSVGRTSRFATVTSIREGAMAVVAYSEAGVATSVGGAEPEVADR